MFRIVVREAYLVSRKRRSDEMIPICASRFTCLWPWRPGPGHPVDSIQRRHAVTFRQGWIVEDGVHEVVDHTVIGHNGLTDMNELGRAVPDGMDAQELSRLVVEEQFQHADLVADQLSPGNFPVAR